jgi:hypothetical protein
MYTRTIKPVNIHEASTIGPTALGLLILIDFNTKPIWEWADLQALVPELSPVDIDSTLGQLITSGYLQHRQEG